MGKEIFFTLCVLDIPLRFQARCRSALFVPNRRLGNKVHRETCTPHLFRHNEFLEIQESVLVKEADVFKGRCSEKESATGEELRNRGLAARTKEDPAYNWNVRDDSSQGAKCANLRQQIQLSANGPIPLWTGAINFRPHHRGSRVLLSKSHELRDRVGEHSRIVIQNEHVICSVVQREAYSYVIARCKA